MFLVLLETLLTLKFGRAQGQHLDLKRRPQVGHSFLPVHPLLTALAGGVTGVAIRNVDYQASYTNGTGSNQIYSNADLTMSNGSATNTFLVGGTVNTPRVWNGTINYTTGVAAPEPASLSLLALGGVGMLAKRRRKGQ
jgi:hypothetical protein